MILLANFEGLPIIFVIALFALYVEHKYKQDEK